MGPGFYRYISSWTVVALTVAGLVGCAQQNSGAKRLVDAQNQVMKLTDDNKKLMRDVLDARQTIDAQQRQIATLQRLGIKRFEELTRVASIQLDRLTGGYHEGQHPYDDGIAVYLQPLDSEGTVLKAAGIVRIRLFDMRNEPRLISEIALDPRELRKTWVGRFWTQHYSIRVPFQKTPAGSNLTVYVDFTELLTGKTFSAEKIVEIRLPPATTAPASHQ